MIKVLFFARVRDQAGRAELELPLPDGVQDLGQLMAVLSQRDEKLQQALSDPRLLMALNQEMAGPDTTVEEGDEVAFFPPVTGG
ncbi:MAG: molybdopterin converting factor subunit 1 [Pseudomonadota bacterium]|nr:molybdopterin converting factor subunit 1 [Pseudomonadales bacterium]MDY6921794.1 molybdopterin converting factor subunit 1 [Pseudomonadota bacterium]